VAARRASSTISPSASRRSPDWCLRPLPHEHNRTNRTQTCPSTDLPKVSQFSHQPVMAVYPIQPCIKSMSPTCSEPPRVRGPGLLAWLWPGSGLPWSSDPGAYLDYAMWSRAARNPSTRSRPSTGRPGRPRSPADWSGFAPSRSSHGSHPAGRGRPWLPPRSLARRSCSPRLSTRPGRL